MPPMWALGFQLCRYGFSNFLHIETVVNRTLSAGIPLDVFHSDIDHMDERKDFTVDQEKFGELPKYLTKLMQTKNIRSIIILVKIQHLNESFD